MTVWGAALVGARVLPLVALAPFLGAQLPTSVRLALAWGLGVALWPLATPPAEAGPLLLTALVLKEAAVGAAIGFVASLVFGAAHAAGRLVETAGNVAGLASAYRMLAVVLFFALGGHRLALTALWRSYQVIPIDAFPAIGALGPAAWLLTRLTADLIAVALGLAAPVLAATLLADLFVSLGARFAPEVAAAVLALPVRAVAALGTLALGLLLMARALGGPLRASDSATRELLRLLAP